MLVGDFAVPWPFKVWVRFLRGIERRDLRQTMRKVANDPLLKAIVVEGNGEGEEEREKRGETRGEVNPSGDAKAGDKQLRGHLKRQIRN